MIKKIEKWLAKKLKVKPENVTLNEIEVKYTFINPDSMEMTNGKKVIKLTEL